MKNLNDKVLSDEALTSVVGGAGSSDSLEDTKRMDFEAAWRGLGLEATVSGIKRGEVFDAWARADYKPDATNFILKNLNN